MGQIVQLKTLDVWQESVIETYLTVCDSLRDRKLGRGGCGVAKIPGRRGLHLIGESWTETWEKKTESLWHHDC